MNYLKSILSRKPKTSILKSENATRKADKPRDYDSNLVEGKLVLDSLIQYFRPMNFHENFNLAPSDSLQEKHFVVAVVDQVVRVAASLNSGFRSQNGFVFYYNRQYWEQISEADVKSFLGKVALLMGVSEENSRFFRFKDTLFKQLISTTEFSESKAATDTVLINLKNGTFEVTRNRAFLRDFRADDFLKYQLGFSYDEKAISPMFDEYLSKVLPDENLQLVLAEFIGYVFTKHLKLEKCLILYGDGANGKSVFYEIVNALLGKENVSNYSLANLNEENCRALISNKLLNYGSEIHGNIANDIFKSLASGENIQARLKYRDSFIMSDYARLCFNCNELPSVVEHTEGYFRRFLIIPFNITIPEEERDPMLAQRIISSELSGVFNWVLSGLHSLYDQGRFSDANVIKEIIKEFKEESDSVLQFLKEYRYIPSKQSYYLYADIMSSYRDFCKANNLRPLGKPKFSKRLKKTGFLIERAGGGGKTSIYLEVEK